MDMIKALKALAEKHLGDQDAIFAKAKADGNRSLTAEELTEIEALTVKVDKALAEYEVAKAHAARQARVSAITVPEANLDVTGTVKAVTGVQPALSVTSPKLTPQQEVGLHAWSKGMASRHPEKSAGVWLDEAGFKSFADEGRAFNAQVNKGMTSLVGGGGDNLIYTPLSNDFIKVLRNRSAFLSGGPLELELPLGALDIPGGNAGAAAAYGAQGADIGYTQMTTRKVSLKAKHLRAITAINNYLIDTSPLQVATIVGEDLVNGMVVGLDAAGLRGDGTGDNPFGIRNIVAGGQIFAAAAGTTPTYTVTDAMFKQMITALGKSNVPVQRPRWIMANRVYNYLKFLRDANGNKVYAGLSDTTNPSLEGLPVSVSEQVPTSLGVSTVDSEIYLIDFGYVVAGVARGIQLTASKEASYKNGGGTLVSSFSLDETVIRAMASHDFNMRYTTAGAIASSVQWT